jgi:hypothetical protein
MVFKFQRPFFESDVGSEKAGESDEREDRWLRGILNLRMTVTSGFGLQ